MGRVKALMMEMEEHGYDFLKEEKNMYVRTILRINI